MPHSNKVAVWTKRDVKPLDLEVHLTTTRLCTSISLPLFVALTKKWMEHRYVLCTTRRYLQEIQPTKKWNPSTSFLYRSILLKFRTVLFPIVCNHLYEFHQNPCIPSRLTRWKNFSTQVNKLINHLYLIPYFSILSKFNKVHLSIILNHPKFTPFPSPPAGPRLIFNWFFELSFCLKKE